MATPKRLPYTTAGAGGGARRGSGTVPPVVVLVFLFVVAPSIFLVARSGGRVHVHVASGPSRPALRPTKPSLPSAKSLPEP
jgi:alpha-1,4-galacturonosyltransferase